METEVKISDLDLTTHVQKWKIEETFGQSITQARIECSKAILDDLEVDIGQSVTIKRGVVSPTEQFKFEGTVAEVILDLSKVIIICDDKLKTLVNKTVEYSYDSAIDPQAGVISAIAEDLIETWGGMTASVVSTGTINTLRKFICSSTDIFSRLQDLADAVDYQIYYDPDDGKVYFEPKGTVSSDVTLYVGGDDNNTLNVPTWEFDSTQLFNRVIVKGAVQEVQDEEYFNGDATTEQSWTLASVPITVQVWEDVGGSLVGPKTAGIEDQAEQNFDYYVDKEDKKVQATTNWTPAVGSNNVKIIYSKSIPVPVAVEDSASIEAYGEIEVTKFFSDIQTINDAEIKGNGLLAKYSTPFVSTKIKVSGTLGDFEAGQLVTVNDSINDEIRTLMITKVIYEYPASGDTLEMGDKEWRISDWGHNAVERIRRLEEEVQKNVDSLTTIKTFTSELSIKTRYIKGISQDIGHTYIMGHSVNSIMGVANGVDGEQLILGEGEDAEYDARVIWPNNTYIETFFDEDFLSSIGGANWDTTNKVLSYE